MPLELVSVLAATEEDRLYQAEQLVRSYCGWHIAPSRADQVVTVSGTGSSIVMLPSMYVTAVASVVVDGYTLVEGTDYVVHREGFLELSSPDWTSRYTYLPGTVVVTFTHGYAAPPDDVVAVVQAVASRSVDSPGSVTQVGQVRYATGSDGAGGALTSWERDALGTYRLPVLA